jgi:hypothetical protein
MGRLRVDIEFVPICYGLEPAPKTKKGYVAIDTWPTSGLVDLEIDPLMDPIRQSRAISVVR